jgi:hypothetical protein
VQKEYIINENQEPKDNKYTIQNVDDEPITELLKKYENLNKINNYDKSDHIPDEEFNKKFEPDVQNPHKDSKLEKPKLNKEVTLPIYASPSSEKVTIGSSENKVKRKLFEAKTSGEIIAKNNGETNSNNHNQKISKTKSNDLDGLIV